ncbi:hypothetical protein [Sphingomicrobium aestuariivivum]|uniref:hypothetical protein n=1 Tax=Sphingomicrobium aestuariivivum TaxID=1582356 RepID=UPI001FD6C2D0|nr:hypothetical protein [Sphingomicrobium aestuariivivum]MCJ8191913.1 hypothetical protein [Sphingomicrobium aestuariivivum]
MGKNVVTFNIDWDGRQWVIDCDDDDVQVDNDGHVRFTIPGGQWQFLQQDEPKPSGTAPDGKDYSTFTAPLSQKGGTERTYCGVYVYDPENNFSVVSSDAYDVKLKDTSDDKNSPGLGKHEYCVMFVNAEDPSVAPLMYDPYVRDKGVKA